MLGPPRLWDIFMNFCEINNNWLFYKYAIFPTFSWVELMFMHILVFCLFSKIQDHMNMGLVTKVNIIPGVQMLPTPLSHFMLKLEVAEIISTIT